MYDLNEIVSFMDDYLHINDIKDKSHNGLQVQGHSKIGRIGLATDAAIDTYEMAVREQCQMLLVHHGLIWGGLHSITGRNYQHIKTLLTSNLNLYAAHLPLDMHPEVGNNAILTGMLSLKKIKPFGNYLGCSIGYKGILPAPLSVDALEKHLGDKLDSVPMTLRFGKEEIRSVAIISGGGASMLEEAITENIDCLITGEGSHDKYHCAKEGHIHMMLLGHYKSETIGVRAMGQKLEDQFPGLETVFLDAPTGF